MDRIINTIGKKIKYYRQLNKISLSSLAKDAKISKSTLFGLEEGRSNPTISTLINISKTLNTNLTELIGVNSDSKNTNINMTLINQDENSSTSIYKLSLLPNELVNLKKLPTSLIEIEVIRGTILDINSNTVISQGEKKAINFNAKLKAIRGEVSAIVKVTKYNDCFYISNDIFLKNPSTQTVENIISHTNSTQINRVILNSRYLIEPPKHKKGIHIVENIVSKELHYYIFTTFKGYISAIKDIKEFAQIESRELDKNINFLKKVENSEYLQREDFKDISHNPSKDIENIISQSIIENYKNVKLLSSSDLDNIEFQSKTYVLIIEELINRVKSMQELKKLSTAIKIYRALEYMLPLKEQELNSDSLYIYNTIRKNLPKAYYFAKFGYIELASNIIENILNSITFNKNIENSMQIYKTILNILQETIDNLDNFNYLNTQENLEETVKELNLKIVKKLNLHPSINSSGKFLYLLEKK